MTNRIVTHPANDAYRNGYDAIFGRKMGPLETMIHDATAYIRCSLTIKPISNAISYEQAIDGEKGRGGVNL